MALENQIDMTKYRAILNTWQLIGKTICTISSSNMDLLHNDHVKNNEPRLAIPLKKYEVITKDIFAVELIPMPDSGVVMIQLNRDQDLIFPIESCEFVEPTMQNVAAAIKSKEDGGKIVFFTNLEAITKCAVTLNNIERRTADKFINDLVAFSSAYEDINSIFVKKSEEYYNSLGLNS